MAKENNCSPEPSKWEKRWKRIEVVSSVILTLAAIGIAFFLGVGQKNIADLGALTEQRQALADLIIALGDKEPRKRKQAAIALSQFGEAAVPTLSLALGDSDKAVQSAAIEAFVHIYTLHDPSIVLEQLTRILKETKDDNSIEGAVLTLIKIKPIDLASTISKIGNNSFRMAIDTLKKEQCLEPLNALMQNKDLSIAGRVYIISAMGDIALIVGEPVVKTLIMFCKSCESEEEIQVTVVNTLGNIMEKTSDKNGILIIKDTLTDLSTSSSDRVRAIVVNCLKPFCNETKVRETINKVATEKDDRYIVSRRIAKDILNLE